MSKTKQFNIGPVDAVLTVVLTHDVVESRREIGDKWGLPEMRDMTGVVCLQTSAYETTPGRSWIFLDANNVTLCNTAHELLHFVEYVDKWFEIDSEEYRAYLLGSLVEDVWKWISKERV